MIGYMCAYLRYYYPVAFTAAYLNNANGDGDIKMGTELARQRGIAVKPIQFRYSRGKYFPAENERAIYKGIDSIKYIGEEAADKLYEMRNGTFSSFPDFLDQNPCDSRQTTILIALGFFKEFGKSGKLAAIYDWYQKLDGKSQFKKDKLPCDESLIRKYADETDKLFRNVRARELLEEICASVENKPLPLRTRLKAQKEFLGYLTWRDSRMCGCYYVLELNTKYSPRCTLYHLGDGEQLVCKVSKKLFSSQPFEKDSILYALHTEKRNKQRHINGQWCKLVDEFETWAKSYQVK